MGIVFEDYPKGPHTILALAIIIAIFFTYYLIGENKNIAWLLIILTFFCGILIFTIALRKSKI